MGRSVKIIAITVGIIFLLTILWLWFWPIKFTTELTNIDGKYYIVEPTWISGHRWMIVGDENGDYSYGKLTEIVNNNPDIVLSNAFYIDSPNRYIIYGEIIGEYTAWDGSLMTLLHCTDFDMIGPITRGNTFRQFSPNYLVPADYCWFK